MKRIITFSLILALIFNLTAAVLPASAAETQNDPSERAVSVEDSGVEFLIFTHHKDENGLVYAQNMDKYDSDDHCFIIYGYDGNAEKVVIPDMISDIKVTRMITTGTFYPQKPNYTVKEIVISKNMEYIWQVF